MINDFCPRSHENEPKPTEIFIKDKLNKKQNKPRRVHMLVGGGRVGGRGDDTGNLCCAGLISPAFKKIDWSTQLWTGR